MRVFKYFLLIFLCVTLSSCATTPEETIVVNKNNISEAIKSVASEGSYSYDKVWDEEYSINHFDVCIEANVRVTNNNYPIYMVKQKSFFDSDFREIIDYFIQGSTGVRDAYDTKEEIEMQIIAVKRGLPYTDNNGNKAWLTNYEGQDEQLAILYEDLATAQEEAYDPISSFKMDLPISNLTSRRKIYLQKQ